MLSLVFWQTVELGAGGVGDGAEDDEMAITIGGGGAGHPLQFLLNKAQERSPLLFFHLVAAMACDAETSGKAARFLCSPIITGYDDRCMSRLQGFAGEEVRALSLCNEVPQEPISVSWPYGE